jgi:hypothetical protein
MRAPTLFRLGRPVADAGRAAGIGAGDDVLKAVVLDVAGGDQSKAGGPRFRPLTLLYRQFRESESFPRFRAAER